MSLRDASKTITRADWRSKISVNNPPCFVMDTIAMGTRCFDDIGLNARYRLRGLGSACLMASCLTSLDTVGRFLDTVLTHRLEKLNACAGTVSY